MKVLLGYEALAAAMEKHKHLWDMEDKTVAADHASTAYPPGAAPRSRSPHGRSSSSKNNGKGGGKDRNPMKGVRLAQADSKRRRFCGAFSSKKGCSQPCPRNQRHACNVIVPDGHPCEGRVGNPNHSAVHCPHLRG